MPNARLHPLTGQPLEPIFVNPKTGRTHWPILGGAPDENVGNDGQNGDQSGGSNQGGQGDGLNEHGFPENTPWTQMPADQQVKYWQHQSRKHEGRAEARKDYDAIKTERDQLKSTTQTAADKALDDARNEGKAAARRELGGQAVDIHVKALASAGRLTDDAVETILDGLDRSKYLTSDGLLDTDKLSKFLDVVAPQRVEETRQNRRDPHQGNRQNSGSRPTGVAAGAEMFANGRTKKTTSTS